MKLVKSLSAAILVLAMLFALVACGTSVSPANTSGQSSTAPAATTPNSGTSDAEQIVVRIGSAVSRGSSGCEFMYQLEEALTKKTDKFVFEMYPGSQFGTNDEMITGVQGNILQAIVLTPSFLAGICPIVEVLAVPFIFPDHKTSLDVLNSDIDAVVKGFQAAGLYPGCWVANGAYWTFSNTPISNVADLKGLNIRTPASDINYDICAAYGCNLVAMTTGDVPMALQQGAIDGTFGTISIGYSAFLGSFKYMIPIHGDAYNTPECFIVSNEFIQSLGEGDRKLFLDTAKEIAVNENYDLYLEYLGEQMKKIEEDGVQINYGSAELRAQLEEVLAPVKENYPSKYPDRADGFNQIVAAAEALKK